MFLRDFQKIPRRFGSLQRPRWRGKGKELANSGSIVRLGLGGVSGKRGVVPTIVRSQRPWSESWGASPGHRIKGGWLSGDSTSIPYLDAIHGKTVNNSTVNTKEGDCSESARSCSPVKKRDGE